MVQVCLETLPLLGRSSLGRSPYQELKSVHNSHEAHYKYIRILQTGLTREQRKEVDHYIIASS